MMAKRQATLLGSWLKPAKKQKVHLENGSGLAGEKAGNRNSELELTCGVGDEAGNHDSELELAYGVAETEFQGLPDH